MWASALVLPALFCSQSFLFAWSEERRGPPIQQVVAKGTIGTIEYEDFREMYHATGDLWARRHPFAGAEFTFVPYRYASMQGRTVFRYRDRRLWLVHNFSCSQPAGTAEVPWTCDAVVFVMKGERPVAERSAGLRTEEAGYALVDAEEYAEVRGDFDHVDPHPSLPVFAGIQRGCCDSDSVVSIFDHDGAELCPATPLYVGGLDDKGTWDKIRIDNGRVRCPDGQRVDIATSERQSAALLIRSHAPGVLEAYRLPEAGDARGDWQEHRRRTGYLPDHSYGDFNGDGVEDLAFLLPRRAAAEPGSKDASPGAGYGLFCLLSRAPEAFRLVPIEEEPSAAVWSHGVATVHPGRYAVLCGQPGAKSLPECRGKPKQIVLKHDAIHRSAFETSSAYYVWDVRRQAFKRVPVSD